MKIFIKILILLLASFGLKAQTPLPTGLPSPRSTSWYDIGWMKADSGIVNAVRSTNFTARFVGTQVFQIRPGVDSLPWWWTGTRWITFPTTGGGGGNFNSFSFTNQNGITGTVTGSTGPNVALALGTSLNGIVKANGSGFGTVVVGSGLTYDGTTLSAGTNINALISGNGTNFIATTIGAGLSYSTVTHTLSNTITNNNQLTNGAGYITNITGLVSAGTNISITGNGTAGNPYVINSSGGGVVTGAGNLSPLFTTSVSVGTINFAFTNPAAFRIFGNPQGISAAPMYFGVDATLQFSGNLLGVNPSAPLNFYQTISQIDSFTFTLNTPTGRHDTVRISLPTNGFVSNLNNGLTLTGSLGQLGGPLVQNTLINGGGFSLGIQGNRFATGMGAAIASANNLTTGSDGNLFSVTGLAQINAITTTNWQNGSEIAFVFTGTPVLKNNTIGGAGTAPMQLAGSIDYQAAPGDYIKFQYDGSFWHEESRKLVSAGGAYIFSNGITESPATRVKLGGTLTQNTTLAGASAFYLAISNGRFQTGAGAAIVAANNLVTGSDGNQFSTTGNTQINAITTTNWQAGSHIELIFTGTPLLKNNTAGGVNTAVMLLAGSTDYQAAAGDLIGFSYDGTVWHETNRKLAGSVTNLTFNNGLTQAGTLVQWGGSLVQNTTITQSTRTVTFSGGVAGTMVTMLNIPSGSGTYTTLNVQANSFSGANSLTAITGFASGINSGTNIGGQFEGDVGSGGGTLAYGVYSQSDHGIGVYGFSLDGTGVKGATTSGSGGFGVVGDATVTGGIGVKGNGATGGVFFGTNAGVSAQSSVTPLGASNSSTGSTNGVLTGISVTRQAAFTGATGEGVSIDFGLTNASSALTASGNIINKFTVATGGSESTQFQFVLANAGSTNTVLTLDPNGNVTTVGGYINHIVNTGAGTYTISAFDWTVIATGTTSTWTFPTAVTGRVLNLVNNGSGAITYGTSITTGNGATTTTSAAGNRDQIQYDGSVWRKIN